MPFEHSPFWKIVLVWFWFVGFFFSSRYYFLAFYAFSWLLCQWLLNKMSLFLYISKRLCSCERHLGLVSHFSLLQIHSSDHVRSVTSCQFYLKFNQCAIFLFDLFCFLPLGFPQGPMCRLNWLCWNEDSTCVSLHLLIDSSTEKCFLVRVQSLVFYVSAS